MKLSVKIACRDPGKIPFERLVEMKKKLYLISFSVEGFDQFGSDDANDDNGPLDIEIEKENGNETEGADKDLLDNEDDAIDELDLANKTVASSSATKQHSSSVTSAVDFQPSQLLEACMNPVWNSVSCNPEADHTPKMSELKTVSYKEIVMDYDHGHTSEHTSPDIVPECCVPGSDIEILKRK